MMDAHRSTALVASAMLVLSIAVGGVFVAGVATADQDKEEVTGVTVDYEGCGNAFLAVNTTDDLPLEVTVEYFDDQTQATTEATITVNESNVDTTPEQFDAEYVFRLADALADEGHSVTVVSVTIEGETFENPNDCLPDEPEQGDDGQDDQQDDKQDDEQADRQDDEQAESDGC